ncbi:MAG: 3-deoxy-8-phosphooctulonate synthase [Deltaproteobacteria bacterium RBG_13_43_22]|nr:MAG: 3-deoxy-8-phosphooctulonate synthase [Deltaproteobacteria bacterium RBG_13_43_22]
MLLKEIRIGKWKVGEATPLLVIAGPCVIEDEATTVAIARELHEIQKRLDLPLVFKASYDKANRTSIHSYRGPGLEAGLELLGFIRTRFELPVLSDVHQVGEIEKAVQVLDVIQIPAFLCRQTDLLTAAGRTGLPVNVKKGQFLSPWDMRFVVEKITGTGNDQILITERGTTFGYNNLVVDIRSLPILSGFGYPVIFDATHSVQLPGGGQGVSGGERRFVPSLARAAVAAGVQGVFLEVHPEPEKALSDGANSWPLDQLEDLLRSLIEIHELVKKSDG